MERVAIQTNRGVVPQVVREILEKRKMPPEEMAAFVYPDYALDLHDPYLLTDMRKAIDRILIAAQNQEKVVVYGDYDIDGITASGVMIEALRAVGIDATSYIPDRFEEGYGINEAALAALKDGGVDLVISVDCGITSVAEAKWAQENGLDLIVTDHHTVPEVIPEAVAVINPKRPGDKYPFKELAGVGVAFKLAQALQQTTGKPEIGQEKWLLDLVALGTVCDLVPLVGENRVFVTYGLKVLRRTRRVGLKSLAAVSKITTAEVTAEHLGFRFGPRMNAAGRLDNAACALELVMTPDETRADEIADQLEGLNQQRKADQEKIFREADAMAEEAGEEPVLVLASPEWSHGVVGIVASKLVEKWQKPVLVAQILGESAKGSGRSVPGFNLTEALRQNESLLERFGGHYYAAGYTVKTQNLDELREGLIRAWEGRAQTETTAELEPEIALGSVESVGVELIDEIELLAPFGHGNRRPVVEISGLNVAEARPVGATKTHLKLAFTDKAGRKIDGIGFGMAPSHEGLMEGQILTAKGELNKNEYLGHVRPQLIVTELVYEQT